MSVDGLGVTLPTIRCCACGSSTIAAVAPGTEGEAVPDLFTVTRGVPLRAWCAGCWPHLQPQTAEAVA